MCPIPCSTTSGNQGYTCATNTMHLTFLHCRPQMAFQRHIQHHPSCAVWLSKASCGNNTPHGCNLAHCKLSATCFKETAFASWLNLDASPIYIYVYIEINVYRYNIFKDHAMNAWAHLYPSLLLIRTHSARVTLRPV